MEIDHHQDMEKYYDNEDRISQLPDSVLNHILSYLTTREAVRTSEISSRWRSLFKSPMNLVFDAHNILDADKYSDIDVSQMHCLERNIVKSKRAVEFRLSVHAYLNRVTEVHKIEKLKVNFTFGNDKHVSELNEWIGFALQRQVEEIDLCMFEENYFSAPSDSLYVFPCLRLVGICLSLKCLRLAHCVLAPGPQGFIFSGFSTLRSLELMKVDLYSDDHVQNLLWNCENIESMSLIMCWKVHYLRIEHPICQKLKYLNVNECPHLKYIVLTGVNVETLEYKGGFVSFQFNITPRLRTVFSGMNDGRTSNSDIVPLCRLAVELPQLETLFLESTCHMAAAMWIPQFRNLRHLIILKLPNHDHNLSWIASILKASPRLQKLELHLRRNSSVVGEELKDRNWPPRCPHEHLEEVVISGMIGHMSEVEIAIYLLKNATSLKVMEIDARPRVYLGNGKWNQQEPFEIWTRTRKNEVEHHLRQHAGATVQLLIL